MITSLMPENASKRYINMAKITMNELSAELTAEELRELEDAEKRTLCLTRKVLQ